MSKKLTLRVPEDLIEAAKKIARDRETSVSQLVASYFQALRERAWRTDERTPVLQRVSGVLRQGDGKKYHAHLEEKYRT